LSKPLKFRKCRYCGEKTVPYGSLQPFCFTNECIKAHNNALKSKKNRKAIQTSRSQEKSLQLKKTQTIINQYIRLRDQYKPCISCGTTNQTIQYHAGHFQPMGANQNLRFNLLNIHKQCSRCNNYLSGNLVQYRENLIKKIGAKRVEILESDKSKSKYTVEYLHRLQEVFKRKIKLYERKFR
jgi:hypothetical protein